MELWKLLFILVVVSALGTFGVFAKWRDHMRGKPFGLHRSHLRHVNYEGFGGGFGVGFNGGFGVGANGGFGDAIEPNFGSVGVDDKKMKNEGFYGGGFGVGFNGGFGVGANGGVGVAPSAVARITALACDGVVLAGGARYTQPVGVPLVVRPVSDDAGPSNGYVVGDTRCARPRAVARRPHACRGGFVYGVPVCSLGFQPRRTNLSASCFA